MNTNVGAGHPNLITCHLLIWISNIAAPRASVPSPARLIAQSLPLLSLLVVRPETLAIDQSLAGPWK